MNEKTRRFVRSKFEEYYRRAKIKIPKDSWMREWGFVLFDQYFPEKLVMRRHKSFATEGELVNYLRENAPAHAYHSAAIYKYPAADMANKGWLGADLIFDLDADHIVSEAEFQRYSYEGLLELVKKETVKLIDFLLSDFGFHEDDIELVFSGSRGYHIHIKTEEVRGLGSRERREIVDYVMATGLDMDSFLAVDSKEKGGEKPGREDLKLIPEGWGKRLLKGLIDFLHEIAEMEEEKAIEEVKKIGEIKEKNARDIIRIAKDETVMKRIERGQIPRFAKPIQEGITKTVTKTVRVKSADRPDEPVTADIKRLIRLPTSLHGKSSLEVKPVRIEAFKDFDPLEDAIAFGDSPVEISAARNSSIEMKGERYEVEEGEIASLPEHVALYFMCRGVAEII
ncbi:MAG: DNA primase catalytic subunit PriS [Methanophagales archaeon]|nr:DNA primase catalytic subunit PriS [Methanophagales archaeon]